MEVKDLIENEDGSATLEVELSAEEIRFLVEKALVALLMEYTQQPDSSDG